MVQMTDVRIIDCTVIAKLALELMQSIYLESKIIFYNLELCSSLQRHL